MSDELYTDDDRLDARLRAGLAALVAEAPEPPPLPAPGAPRSTDRRLLAVAAAVVAVGVLVATIVAVSRGSDESLRTEPGRGRPLVGTTWVLDDVIGDGEKVPMLSDTLIDVRFDPCEPSTTTVPSSAGIPPLGQDCPGGLRVSGSLGCNTFVAGAGVEGDRLTVHQRMATVAGCDAPWTRIEAVAERVLDGRGSTIAISGDELRIERGADRLVYRAAVAPGIEELVGTEWRLAEAREGQAVTGPDDGSVSLEFDRCADAACADPLRVGGHDGCNDFGADGTIEQGRLRLGDVGATLVGCPDGVHQIVRRTLRTGASVAVADGVLFVRAQSGDSELVYRRALRALPDLVGTELAAGRRDDVIYRLSWEHNGGRGTLRLDHSSTGQSMQASMGFDLAGLDADPVLENSGPTDIGVGSYLWGIAPSGTARVVAEVGGRSVAIALYPLDGTDLQAFGGLLDQPPATVVAFDAAGQELARKRLA
jgi:heat shock protein HslJ